MCTKVATSFSALIDLWPSYSAMADGISARGRHVGAGAVKQWRRRDAIPSGHFEAIINAAREVGIEGVTADLLVALAARKTEEPAA